MRDPPRHEERRRRPEDLRLPADLESPLPGEDDEDLVGLGMIVERNLVACRQSMRDEPCRRAGALDAQSLPRSEERGEVEEFDR